MTLNGHFSRPAETDPYDLPSGGNGSCRCREAIPGGDRGGEGGQIFINLFYIINDIMI